jgi:RecA/RadA recombinase
MVEQTEQPMLSFEITSCYKLATKPEVKLSTGCKVLNDLFRGGLLPRRVYEVYGESGTGKTQFAI